MSNFQSLGLCDELVRALSEMNISEPTPIQEQAIPALLQNDTDFIGLAQTGTGKTASFGLPLLEKIETDRQVVQALVLAPTRELCQQIAGQLEEYGKYLPNIQTLPVFGGASISDQIRKLKNKPKIVIATPGRLIDLVERRAIDLSKIDFVVLDEADEMLNMGFKEELDKILSFTPETKSTWLFSATMPSEIRRIIKKYMDNPIEVAVSKIGEVNKNIDHQFIYTKTSDKLEVLRRFIELNHEMRGIVFCRTKRDTEDLAATLKKYRYKAEALNGDLSQAQRDKVMASFREESVDILIATDVAARGIDVNDLTHVIHFSLPDDPEYYTHRSGRTARAGKKGISLAIISGRDTRKIRDFERNLKLSFTEVPVPSAEEIAGVRMKLWAEALLNMKPAKQAEHVLSEIKALFESMTKDELLEKLVSRELHSLTFSQVEKVKKPREGADSGRRGDSFERGGRGRDKDKRRGRGDSFEDKKRPRKRSGDDLPKAKSNISKEKSSNMERYFINVGRRDGMEKRDLIDFIAEQSGIPHRSIGQVDFQQSISFFEVAKDSSGKVLNSLKDLSIDGRKLRINRDEA